MLTKPKHGTPETRTFASASLRADTSKFQLSGIAASYNTLSANLGGFREKIAPGAFSRSLKGGADVRCLFNHQSDKILGRTKSGTLVLSDSREGLRYTCQLDRTNSDHANIFSAVKRGDITQNSFAFTVPAGGDTWEDSDGTDGVFAIRTLRDVDLLDVSPCTYPAYPQGTQLDARKRNVQRPAHLKLPKFEDELRRQRLARANAAVAEDRRALAAADAASKAEAIRQREEDAVWKKRMRALAGIYN